MSSVFCPDCAAQCAPQDTVCHECQFPLEMVVHRDGTGVQIRDEKVWKRVSAVLKRGGLRIQQKSVPSANAVWMALPAVGLAILLASLFFGGSLVDMIWEPPKAAAKILDLNNPNPSKDPAEDATNDESVAYLTDALGTSSAQEQATFDADIDEDSFIDRPLANEETIRKALDQSYLTMMVKDRKRRATLINSNGMVLTDWRGLEDAFQREIITVNENRSISERAVFVVPKLSSSLYSEVDGEQVRDDENLNLSLLSSSLGQGHQVTADFDYLLDMGQKVWTAREVSGSTYLEAGEIIDGFTLGDDGQAWLLSSELSITNSGAPVINKYGDICGILLVIDDQNILLPLLTVRERAPLIFKEILR